MTVTPPTSWDQEPEGTWRLVTAGLIDHPARSSVRQTIDLDAAAKHFCEWALPVRKGHQACILDENENVMVLVSWPTNGDWACWYGTKAGFDAIRPYSNPDEAILREWEAQGVFDNVEMP